MWWEALPSFSVIIAGAGLLPIVVYLTNKIELGNPYRRKIVYISDSHFYLRDERVSGCNNPYLQKGLENIPGESSSKCIT